MITNSFDGFALQVATKPSNHGFSLLELLLVTAIIAIATAVVMPRFSVAMSGGQLTVGARTLARVGRYARTMALLHQTEVELILQIDQEDPEIRVEAVGARAARQAVEPDAPPASDDPVFATERFSTTEQTSEAATDHDQTSYDEIQLVRKLTGVRIDFLGYLDRHDSQTNPRAQNGQEEFESDQTVRIRFAANGLCRPYRLRVVDGGGVWRELTVDVVGQAEIRDPDS